MDTDIHTDRFGFQTWSLEIAACIQASRSACILQQNVAKFKKKKKKIQFTFYQFTYRSPKLPQKFQKRPEKKKAEDMLNA